MRRLVSTSVCGALLLALSGSSAGQTTAPPTDERLTGRLYVTSWFGGVVSVVDLAAGTLRQIAATEPRLVRFL